MLHKNIVNAENSCSDNSIFALENTDVIHTHCNTYIKWVEVEHQSLISFWLFMRNVKLLFILICSTRSWSLAFPFTHCIMCCAHNYFLWNSYL